MLKTLHKLGLDSKEPVSVRGAEVAPRDVVAAALPDPATLGERMHGKTCAGTLVTGIGKDGEPRATYLYHVADNEQTMREYGSQAVVLQTALNPVIALELLATARGTARGCSARRLSTRRRSSTCWPPTAHRTAEGVRGGWPRGSHGESAVAGCRAPPWGGDARAAAAPPGIDESWENHPAHFWLVLGAASLSVGLG